MLLPEPPAAPVGPAGPAAPAGEPKVLLVFNALGCSYKESKPEECVRAFEEVLDKIGKLQQVYHDNEGSFSSTEFIRPINHN